MRFTIQGSAGLRFIIQGSTGLYELEEYHTGSYARYLAQIPTDIVCGICNDTLDVEYDTGKQYYYHISDSTPVCEVI